MLKAALEKANKALASRVDQLATQVQGLLRELGEYKFENRKLKEQGSVDAKNQRVRNETLEKKVETLESEIEIVEKDLKETHKAYDKAKVEVYDLMKSNHQLMEENFNLEDAAKEKAE